MGYGMDPDNVKLPTLRTLEAGDPTAQHRRSRLYVPAGASRCGSEERVTVQPRDNVPLARARASWGSILHMRIAPPLVWRAQSLRGPKERGVNGRELEERKSVRLSVHLEGWAANIRNPLFLQDKLVGGIGIEPMTPAV